jgi:hypothetical protein
MRVEDGGEKNETQPGDVIVLDLVLYRGKWFNGRKQGTCRFFLCYRNYCLPRFPKPIVQNKSNVFDTRLHLHSGSSRLSANDILRSSQFLSGCFFTGAFGEGNFCDLLSYGSLFYYHKRFCLICEKPQKSFENQHNWLIGNVKYFDCITGSSFTSEWKAASSLTTESESKSAKWEKKNAAENKKLYEGIWSMGSVYTSEGAEDPDDPDSLHGEGKYCVRDSLKIKDSKTVDFAGGDWIDIKDGLPGRMMRLFKVCCLTL